MEIKISDIKPIGNFDSTLKLLRKKADEAISLCDKKGEYNKSIRQILLFVFDTVFSLEEGIIDGDIWDMDEAKMCLLYAIIISIDLNRTAHKHLNNAPGLPLIDELRSYIYTKREILGNIIIKD